MKYAAIFLFFLFTFSLNAQERSLNTGMSIEEQQALVGMMLSDVIDRFGPPRTVAAARGIELWQDDVVFQYTGVDFYIYRNRVWQIRFNATHGISNGDRKDVVMFNLGDAVIDMNEYVLLPIDGKDWPLMLRINFNSSENVSSIFLYHPYFE